ncbi:MAG: efflux RND transporter periplasmic adaptor subunit [Gammaproteobacteria bacterium]|nr:efflux RND transporter periplasmic adaptor subunit [Gammaproteobacteria bacterium]
MFAVSRKPIILLLVGSFVLAACDDEPAASRRDKSAHTVEVEAVRLEQGRETLLRSAPLLPRQSVKLLNEEEGRLVDLLVYEGDRVKIGQVLARFDDGLLRAELAKAKARRKQAVEDWKRLQVLVKQGMVSEEIYSQARTEVAVASADERYLAKRLSYMTLRAPIDGVVSQRHVEPGDVAQRYTHIYTLIDDSSLRLQATVSEDQLARIDRTAGVSLRIDALGGTRYPASVARIFPAMDADTHQGTVELLLANPPPGARAGQLAQAAIELKPSAYPLIPVIALRQDEKGPYVFRVNKASKVERVTVQSGRYHDKHVAITRGLKPGDRVVVRGFLGLKPGKTVEVVAANGAD